MQHRAVLWGIWKTGKPLVLMGGCTGILWSGRRLIELSWSWICWTGCPQLAQVKQRLASVRRMDSNKNSRIFSLNQTDSMGLVLCSVPFYIALHTSGMCNGEDQIQQLVTRRGPLVFSHSLWIWQDKILLKVYSLHLCAQSFSKALWHLSPLAIKVCRQSSE